MNRILILELVAFLTFTFNSCVSVKKVTCTLREDKFLSVKIEVPKYKKKDIYSSDGERYIEYSFWYKDSAVFYVSTFEGGSTTHNYDNINQSKLINTRLLADSATFEGKDSKGRHWKEHKIGNIFVGYSKIDMSQKGVFDKAIGSIELIIKVVK